MRCYAVLAPVSRSYSPLKGRLVTCYSPVRHFTHGLLHFLVRLACVRHAASVDSEPGSNSRLKPDAIPVDGGQHGLAVPQASQLQGTLPCENDQAKPDRFSRLARSTNLSKIHYGDSPERGRGSSDRICIRASSNLFCAGNRRRYYLLRRFCANLLNISNFAVSVKRFSCFSA